MPPKLKQSGLRNFFGAAASTSAASTSAPPSESASTSSSVSADVQTGIPSSPTEPTVHVDPQPEADQVQDTTPINIDPWDIGNFVDTARQLDDSTKRKLLLNPWKPPKPTGKLDLIDLHSFGTKNRSFSHSWFDDKDFKSWITFSQVKLGGWCRICLFFDDESANKVGGKNRCQFVDEPWRNYKKADTMLPGHQETLYHKNARIKMNNFLERTANGGEFNVRNLVIEQEGSRLRHLKEVLPSILNAVMYLGKRGLAFLGNTHDPYDTSSNNKGNFLDLIWLLSKTDDKLKDHLEKCAKNSTHLSPKVQNELIDLIGQHIQRKIVQEIKAAKYFTIMADETSDRSRVEQMCLAVRYVHQNEIKEAFLGYIDVVSTTGEVLTDTILKMVTDLGLDMNDCRGQAYDGASNMQGYMKGVQARICRLYPKAVYTHCASHELNLCLASSCKLPDVSHVIATVKEVNNYLFDSPKRIAIFDSVMEQLEQESVEGEDGAPSSKKRKINRPKTLSETRWTSRNASLDAFSELFDVIVAWLTKMANSRDASSATALALLNTVTSFRFVVSLVVSQYILGISSAASKILQAKQNDVVLGYDQVQRCIAVLKDTRSDPESHFKQLWGQASEIADRHGIAICMPRKVGRSVYKSNVPGSTPEQHYRIALFIPLLDSFISELTTRFSTVSGHAIKAALLLPSKMEGKTVDELMEQLQPTLELYESDLPCSLTAFRAHLVCWEQYWRTQTAVNPLPASIIDTLKNVDHFADRYPAVYCLLQIFATIAVTTVTVERAFSALKFLKNDYRTTMTETRLNGLAYMYCHKQDIDTYVNIQSVVNEYCLMKDRRDTKK